MVRLGLLFALTAAVIGFVWHQLGQPVPLPPGPVHAQKLNCLSYAPFRGEQAPYMQPLRIPEWQMEQDVKRLSEITDCIRTYSAAGPERKAVRIAGALGMKVLQGIWLNRNLADNRREIEAALRLVRQHPGVIEAIIVGNEALLRGELGPERIKTYLEEVRRRGKLPVTYADVWEFWLKAPELAQAADFVTIHILPYWEDHPVRAEDAAEHVAAVRGRMAEAFPGKEILIGEVGWPSQGRMRAGALPSPANQALVLGGVAEAAKQGGWKVNLIEAFDQPWKRMLEGTVGGYWGLFDGDSRAPKFRFGEPVSNHPHWRLVAALGIGAALLVFAAAWFGLQEREPMAWGTGFAVAAIAIVSGLVFGAAALGLPMEPPELGDRLRSAAMLVLSLTVPMLAAVALVRAQPLAGLEVALNPPLWRLTDAVTVLLACLFAATLIATMHIALGLVFDPRYKDFQLLLLTGPVAGLAILASLRNHGAWQPGIAETAAAALLTGSALFVIWNEGIANRQALWFAALLGALAVTALRTSPARSPSPAPAPG
jgi:exo-beta-1,3-glucanase (GH17 family)